MAKKTYSEKLKDPRWQKKRLEILNIHGFKCEKCGCEEKELHVHHRFYISGREVWQYDNDVFQVLCCDCHEKEHSKESINEKIIEVIPERYKKLTQLLDKLENKEKDSIECLEYIIGTVLEIDELSSLFSDLSTACNSSYINVLSRLASDNSRLERIELDYSFLKHQFEREILQIKQQLNQPSK